MRNYSDYPFWRCNADPWNTGP